MTKMSRGLLGVLALLLMLTCETLAVAGTADAIVRLKCPDGGGGSGVCVDPSGVIVSIKHVVASGPCRVHFPDGSEYAGRVVVGSEKSDFPVVIRLSGVSRPLPFLRVAEKSPPIGETVWFAGYPAAVRRDGKWIEYGRQQYTVIKSRVLGRDVFFEEDNRPGLTDGDVRLFKIADPVFFGGSGGPCLNANAEVVGIVTTTAGIPESMIPKSAGRATNQVDRSPGQGGGRFVETFHVRSQLLLASMTEADATGMVDSAKQTWSMPVTNRQPELVVLTADWCGGCVEFKKRAPNGTFGGLTLVYVEHTKEGWSNQSLYNEFRAATGPHSTVMLPTLWVRGTKQYKVWSPREHSIVLDWLGGILDALLGLRRDRGDVPQQAANPQLPQQQQASGDVSQETLPEPKPEPVTEPDWSHVKVVVLAAEQPARFSEVGRKYLLQLGIGPLERAIASRSDGKASLQIVAERLSPARYEAVTEAVGQVPDKFLVIVLAKKQPLGLLKGAITARVESAVRDKLGNIPVDALFEREHPADFAAVELALKTPDVEQYQREEPDEVAEDAMSEPVADDAVSEADATPAVVAEEAVAAQEPEAEKSLPESIVATLLMMLTGGLTTTAVKAKLKERALNKVKAAALSMLGQEVKE